MNHHGEMCLLLLKREKKLRLFNVAFTDIDSLVSEFAGALYLKIMFSVSSPEPYFVCSGYLFYCQPSLYGRISSRSPDSLTFACLTLLVSSRPCAGVKELSDLSRECRTPPQNYSEEMAVLCPSRQHDKSDVTQLQAWRLDWRNRTCCKGRVTALLDHQED